MGSGAPEERSRREVLAGAALAAAAVIGGCARERDGPAPSRSATRSATQPSAAPAAPSGEGGTLAFIRRCARDDGGYGPSPDPKYLGNSDTSLSDLAAVTYAAVLARTMEWELPHPMKSIEFIRRHQQPDGRFVNLAGRMKADDRLSLL